MSVLMFGGQAYYPAGGWGDFIGEFDDLAAAKANIDARRVETFVPERSIQMSATIHHSTGRESRKPFRVGDRVNSGVITEVNGDLATLVVAEHTRVDYDIDWAQVVESGKVVFEWTAP